jgi:hypothetical protein
MLKIDERIAYGGQALNFVWRKFYNLELRSDLRLFFIPFIKGYALEKMPFGQKWLRAATIDKLERVMLSEAQTEHCYVCAFVYLYFWSSDLSVCVCV